MWMLEPLREAGHKDLPVAVMIAAGAQGCQVRMVTFSLPAKAVLINFGPVLACRYTLVTFLTSSSRAVSVIAVVF